MILVKEVEAMDDYFLRVVFENGEIKYVDFKPFLSRGGMGGQLRKKELFNTVHVSEEWGGIEWDNGADMSHFDLYEIGVLEIPKRIAGHKIRAILENAGIVTKGDMIKKSDIQKAISVLNEYKESHQDEFE